MQPVPRSFSTICQYSKLGNEVQKNTHNTAANSGSSHRGADGGISQRHFGPIYPIIIFGGGDVKSPERASNPTLNTANVDCAREPLLNCLNGARFNSSIPHPAEQHETITQFTEPERAQNTEVRNLYGVSRPSAYTAAATSPTATKQTTWGTTCLPREDAKGETPPKDSNGGDHGARNTDGALQPTADEARNLFEALLNWIENSRYGGEGGEYKQPYRDAAGDMGGPKSSKHADALKEETTSEGACVCPATVAPQETEGGCGSGGDIAKMWAETGLFDDVDDRTTMSGGAAAVEATEPAALGL